MDCWWTIVVHWMVIQTLLSIIGAEIHEITWYQEITFSNNAAPKARSAGFLNDIPTDFYDNNSKKFSYLQGLGSKSELVPGQEIHTTRCHNWELLRFNEYKYLVKETNATNPSNEWFNLQIIMGCLIDTNSEKIESFTRYAMNGEDYLHMTLSQMRWVAIHPAAEKLVKKFNQEKDIFSNYNIKSETYCKTVFHQYKELMLKKRARPNVKILTQGTDLSAPSRLICHVTGFYPRNIEVTWERGEISLQNEQSREETLPNNDLTYQVKVIIETAYPSSEYRCLVKHCSLENDLHVIWVPPARIFTVGFICIVCVSALIILVLISVGLWRLKMKRMKRLRHNVHSQNCEEESEQRSSQSLSKEETK